MFVYVHSCVQIHCYREKNFAKTKAFINSGVNQAVKKTQKVVPRQRLLHPLRSISTDSPQYFENEDKTEHKCYLNGGMFVNGN